MDSLQAAVEVAKVAMEKGMISGFDRATDTEGAKRVGLIIAAFITTVYEQLEAKLSPAPSVEPPFDIPEMIVEDTEPESTTDPE